MPARLGLESERLRIVPEERRADAGAADVARLVDHVPDGPLRVVEQELQLGEVELPLPLHFAAPRGTSHRVGRKPPITSQPSSAFSRSAMRSASAAVHFPLLASLRSSCSVTFGSMSLLVVSQVEHAPL